MSNYLVGVDIGTQGTKAVVFDEDMRVCGEGFEASRLISPKPGVVWQEAEDILGSVGRTVKTALDGSGIRGGHVACVGVDGQMAGIMGVRQDGSAATYYDSWLDTRCGGHMRAMRREAGARCTEITGGPVTYTHGPKILWWKHERPEIYGRIHKFVLPHAFVVMQMCGLTGDEAYFDYTCLQYSGFGDNLNKEWSGELLDRFGIEPGKMARIVSPFEIVGRVTADFAGQSGLREGTPVAAGLGDTAAATFGSGMISRGVVQDCAGTASVLCTVVEEYRPDTEYETMTQVRSPIDGLWLPLAYINGGGLCIRWFRDCLTGSPPAAYEELEAEAKDLPPGSEGILFMPHFSGRVLPQNPYVKGSFVGLDWKHTRSHMYRAILEGIGYEYAYYYSVIKKLFPRQEFTGMAAIGGGAKSGLFNQIKADILNLPVTTFASGETALAGSAVVAGVACGLFPDYREPLGKVMSEGKTFRPDPESHEAYQPFAREYLHVIRALEPIYQSAVYNIE
ncbi:MAG: FGGY family carbohydrate kinase [Clostridia bacterium]|nr:FGGY family carbohydrate kinase [Clostridia bacterium]